MARLLGVDWEGDVRVAYVDDGDRIGVSYQQNVNPILDKIAAINAEGGAQTNDGMGRLKYEFPVTLIMEHAIERGIAWEKLAYAPGYDDEWAHMASKWSKLTVEQKRKYL